MALSASAKENLSRLFPGDPSPLWDSDPEFMELFTNFALAKLWTRAAWMSRPG